VSKADGDNFEPLDFDLPDDDLTEPAEELDAAGEAELESVDESALSEEPGLDQGLDDFEEPSASEDEAREIASKPGKKKKEKKKKEKNPKTKKPREKKPEQVSQEAPDLATLAVWVVCGLSCLGVLVADVVILSSRGGSSIVFIILLTTIWLMGTAIPFLLWKSRRTNNAYVVFLGISLAGILVANILLLLELATYGGDISAKGAQSTHIAPAVQSAPANTTATA
jgi:cation transport ATPase